MGAETSYIEVKPMCLSCGQYIYCGRFLKVLNDFILKFQNKCQYSLSFGSKKV